MILSRKLLQKYIPTLNQVTNDEILDRIISIGLEVEKKIEIVQTEYLTIGQVLSVKQHTYSPKNLVCTIKIKTGNEKDDKITVVCEKSLINNKAIIDKYVIVALSGCEIGGGVVVEKDIKGIISEGIICTYNQLAQSKYPIQLFTEIDDEIVVLDYGSIGDTSTDKYIALDDCLFEITIPHNRNELHGVKYIAKELSVALNMNFTCHENTNVKIKKKQKNEKNVPDFINQTRDKNLFIGGINIVCDSEANSPWILKGLLLNHWIQPTSLVENICQLATIFTGVPLFLCDLDKIQGDIFVKLAKENTTISDPQGKKITIEKGDLILTDSSDHIITLAGICLNADFAIKATSKNVLAIFGNYDINLLAKTTDRLGVVDSIAAKGINFVQCHDVVVELKNLITELANYENNLNIDAIICPSLLCPKYGNKVKIDFESLNNFLGFRIKKKKIKSILSKLGFTFRFNGVLPPAYRNDINCWQDVAEEIIKITEINHVPQIAIKNQASLHSDTYRYDKMIRVIQTLTNLQFHNVITKNICSREEALKFDFFNYQQPLKLKIQARNSYLRLGLTERLLQVLACNNKMKTDLIPIFEIQKIYSGFREEHHLGALLPTGIFPISWKPKHQLVNDIFLAKGITQKIINTFGFECEFQKNDNPWFEKNHALEVFVYNNLVGYVGLIAKKWLHDYGLDMPVYCIELNIEQLVNSFNTSIDKKRETLPSNFQRITKDITLSLDKNDPKQTFSFLKSLLNKVEEIEKWNLISVFDEPNQISYTIRYDLNQELMNERTSEEINSIIEKISKKLTVYGIKIK